MIGADYLVRILGSWSGKGSMAHMGNHEFGNHNYLPSTIIYGGGVSKLEEFV
jgi:hypothetical protein